jgi:hypothetical protein
MAKQDLYFMLNPFTGLIKIGVSADVNHRRFQLECSAGVGLTVMATVTGGEPYEQQLHLAFHGDRQCGEWFLPSDDLLGLIDNPDGIGDYLVAARPRMLASADAILEAKRIANAERVAELAAERAAVKAAKMALRQKKEAAEKRREERKRQQERDDAAVHEERLRAFQAKSADWLAQKGLRLPDADQIAAHRLAKIRQQRQRNLEMLGVG